MKRRIEIGKHAGFCGGVNLCVKVLNDELENSREIYCLGELVHNKDVVNEFKNKGVIFVNSLDEVPDRSKLVIRAHGAEKHTYELANKRGISVLDLTCPKVAKIRKEVEEYVNSEDKYIILIAQKNHPEAKSTISFSGRNSCIVETKEDINELLKQISKFKTLVIIAQTTFDERLFLEYAKYIKDSVGVSTHVIVKNTICNATSVRQEETRKMAKEKDCMIVIGGKNSSNTKKLYNIAKSECANTYIVENKEELDLNKIKDFSNIGIMAGASTPINVISEVSEAISGI